jgi:uncharacterized protein
MSTACRIIVMAKAPVAGLAKTRLIPALGADGAAALAQRLLEHALQQSLEHARRAGLDAVELCCAPDARHPGFAAFAAWPGLVLTDQGDGDLGQRMARALDRALNGHATAILIGTDAPALVANVLHLAQAALRDHDAVFVPALDGGYALVGLRRPIPALFDAMPWSTPHVMPCSRERLAAGGASHVELEPVADIDVPADLVHLPAGWL